MSGIIVTMVIFSDTAAELVTFWLIFRLEWHSITCRIIAKGFLLMDICISGWEIFSSKELIMDFFWFTILKDIMPTTKVTAAKDLTT
jgi:hypothetical protein